MSQPNGFFLEQRAIGIAAAQDYLASKQKPYCPPRRWPKALAWVAIVTVMAVLGYLAVSDALARGMAPHFELISAEKG